ncbi:50S ribosomal protein L18 [Bienertia sinuspersici]
MALLNVKPVQQLECCFLNKTDLELFKANSLPMQSRGMPIANGNLTCLEAIDYSSKLYAMLVDDVNKKCLYYRSTLQKSLRSDPDIGTVAAKVVGEELVKAAMNLSIDEITSYDRNGCVRGERVKAFEIALSQHDTLPLLAIACFGERPLSAPWLKTIASLLDDLNDESLDY